MSKVIDLRELLENVDFLNFIDYWCEITDREKDEIINKLKDDDMFREIFFDRYSLERVR